MTEDEKRAAHERLVVDAKRIAKDGRRYVALPAVILEATVAGFVDSLARIIERGREEGHPYSAATVYTTARGRHVRVTVEEVADPAAEIYSESWTGVIEKVTRGGPVGASFAVAPSRRELDRIEAERGHRPVGHWIDFPTNAQEAYDDEGRSTLLSQRARVTVTVEREPKRVEPAAVLGGVGWNPGRLR